GGGRLGARLVLPGVRDVQLAAAQPQVDEVADDEGGGDEQDGAPLQPPGVPGQVVDGLARPGEVDDHEDLVDDRDDVDRDGPPAEAEQPLAVLVGPLGGGGAGLAAGTAEP